MNTPPSGSNSGEGIIRRTQVQVDETLEPIDSPLTKQLNNSSVTGFEIEKKDTGFATSNIERTATMETAASVGGINLGAILAASPDNDELKLTPKENPNTPKLIKPTDNPASLTP
ncbi:MAG: hypothetical protein GX221_04350 [Candidatus Riflebacteria bacterium]|nr:hypothetical protein [Candidatus Riflebacteria bacterium]